MGRAHRTSSSLTCLCSFTQLVKNPLQCRRPLLDSWVKKFPWRRNRLPTPVFLGFPGGSDSKESACNEGDPGLIPWVGKIPWRRDRLPTPVFLGFPCGSTGKESACSVEDRGLISGLGRCPGEGNGYSLQYSGLENSMGHTELDTTE